MGKQKIFFLFIAAILFSKLLFAQTKDTLANRLDEVIVTANKTEQKQSTTGKVITVIGKDIIEKSGGKTVAQLLNEQAGIVVNGAYGNPGSVQTIYMRGANSGRALILLDGIPISDPTDINNAFDLNLISVNDVERIEIAKGAQSTLYGSDAIAGVINIITTKKDISKPVNLKATLSGGNLGTFRGNAQLYGKADKFTYTVRYSKYLTNGFSAAYDRTGKNHFDNDGFNGNAVNATAQYQATENLLFKAFALYSQYKTDLDAGPFQDDKYYTANNNNFTTGAGFKFNKGIVSVTGNYQFSQMNRKYFRDSSLDKTANIYFINNKYFGKAQFAELYATIQLGSGFSLLQGGDFRWNSMNQNYVSASSYGPYSSSFGDTAISQSSLYSSLIYNSEDKKLNVELGGRLNVNSRYGSNYTYTFNPSYSLSEHFRVFGSIATGFKTPSIYQLFLDSSLGGNPNLRPEKSTNYELGIQQQYHNFSHRLVGFYRNIKDGLDFDYVTYKYFNFDKQKAKGIEYEITVKPLEQLTITGNYTLLIGQETIQNRVNTNDTTYHYLLRRPKHNINLNVGYQLHNFYLSLNGKYVSKRYDISGFQAPDVKLDSYFLFGAYAEYKFCNKFKVFADVQNIFNKKFFDIYGYNSIPFVINGGVTINL